MGQKNHEHHIRQDFQYQREIKVMFLVSVKMPPKIFLINMSIFLLYLLGLFFLRVLSDPYSDVLYSEECQTKTLSVVCYEMFVFFKDIFRP